MSDSIWKNEEEKALLLELLSVYEKQANVNIDQVSIISEADHSPVLRMRHNRGELLCTIHRDGEYYKLDATDQRTHGGTSTHSVASISLEVALRETLDFAFPPMLLS